MGHHVYKFAIDQTQNIFGLQEQICPIFSEGSSIYYAIKVGGKGIKQIIFYYGVHLQNFQIIIS